MLPACCRRDAIRPSPIDVLVAENQRFACSDPGLVRQRRVRGPREACRKEHEMDARELHAVPLAIAIALRRVALVSVEQLDDRIADLAATSAFLHLARQPRESERLVRG